MTTQQLIKDLLPPALLRFTQGALDYVRPAPMEYLPGDWPDTARGWNVESIAQFQQERWSASLAALQSVTPLGVSPAALAAKGRQVDVWDIIGHNNIMAYAYVLALAAHGKDRIALLDWGGGIGYYYALSKALMPGLELDYHCQDLPVFCAVGRRNLPDVTFWEEPDACFARSYDLVFAGSSLWYARDWRTALGKMAASSTGYVFVNRMIFVQDNPSFAAIQRPGKHAYDTEYPMWILNRGELLDAARNCGLAPVREFLIGHGPHIHRAPEQGAFRGFLFRRL